jgi:hypothetical protein
MKTIFIKNHYKSVRNDLKLNVNRCSERHQSNISHPLGVGLRRAGDKSSDIVGYAKSYASDLS